MADDGRLTVRVQLLDHYGYEPWPTSIRDLDQRYSDAPRAALRVPTPAAFSAWKTVAWHDRAAPRDLWDLWALARHGHITPDAAELFAAHGPTRNVPPPWMFTKAPSEEHWREQLAGQTRLTVTAAEALDAVAAAWAATAGRRRPVILRCTAKARALLGARGRVESGAGDDEWYLNVLWFDRRKCLLLVHVDTLFPVLIADVCKADLTPIDAWIERVVRRELALEGLAEDTLGSLTGLVTIAKTASRQILGFMNEMALQADYAIAEARQPRRLRHRRAQPMAAARPAQPRRPVRDLAGAHHRAPRRSIS